MGLILFTHLYKHANESSDFINITLCGLKESVSTCYSRPDTLTAYVPLKTYIYIYIIYNADSAFLRIPNNNLIFATFHFLKKIIE